MKRPRTAQGQRWHYPGGEMHVVDVFYPPGENWDVLHVEWSDDGERFTERADAFRRRLNKLDAKLLGEAQG